MNQSLLTKGIEIVGALLAAFSGFLIGIAPPQAADAKFAVGISSFLSLIILFIIVALTRQRKKYRRVWIVAGICLLVIYRLTAYTIKPATTR